MMGNLIVILILIISANLYILGKNDFAGLLMANPWLVGGQLAAILGAVMLSITFVMSARLRWVEKFFGGLDKQYKYHQIYGIAALVFLINHPLFLAITRLPDYSTALQLLLPSTNMEYNFGILALHGMILLLILTLLVNLPYRIWLKTHQFMGIVLGLAMTHVFLINSDVARNMALRFWVLGWMTLGGLGFIYRKILSKYLAQKRVYKVKEVREIENIVEIEMEPEGRKLDFKAGQFAFFRFEQEGLDGEEHPFSMVNIPNCENIIIVVKVLGDFTLKLKNINKGTRVTIDGPFGDFSRDFERSKDAVLIAGGIGITPLLSMVSKESEEPKKRKVKVIYCVRDKKDAYGEEVLRKSDMVLWESSKMGRLGIEEIKKTIGEVKGKMYFLCGPTGMMTNIRDQLVASGVKPALIHFEDFSFK